MRMLRPELEKLLDSRMDESYIYISLFERKP